MSKYIPEELILSCPFHIFLLGNPRNQSMANLVMSQFLLINNTNEILDKAQLYFGITFPTKFIIRVTSWQLPIRPK